MPGKVNPVIPEVVNQVCFLVIGSDLTVTMAAEAGQLQLNVMEPVIAACLLEGQTLLRTRQNLARVTIEESWRTKTYWRLLERSIGTVTALNR
jgi:aspartate ammonia-lyase